MAVVCLTAVSKKKCCAGPVWWWAWAPARRGSRCCRTSRRTREPCWRGWPRGRNKARSRGRRGQGLLCHLFPCRLFAGSRGHRRGRPWCSRDAPDGVRLLAGLIRGVPVHRPFGRPTPMFSRRMHWACRPLASGSSCRRCLCRRRAQRTPTQLRWAAARACRFSLLATRSRPSPASN